MLQRHSKVRLIDDCNTRSARSCAIYRNKKLPNIALRLLECRKEQASCTCECKSRNVAMECAELDSRHAGPKLSYGMFQQSTYFCSGSICVALLSVTAHVEHRSYDSLDSVDQDRLNPSLCFEERTRTGDQ